MRLIIGLILVLGSQLAMANSIISTCSSDGSCGTRGGGDFLEWSFYDLAQAVVPHLVKSEDLEIQADAKKMAKILRCLKVEVSEKESLNLDGRSVMAINVPAECKIILSRPSWENLKSNQNRIRLVLHELLSLALIQDFQYQRSQRLAEAYIQMSEKPVVSRVNTWKIFTESDVFQVPADVTSLRVTVVGAGGGGGGGHLNRGSGGGGGAGGAVKTRTLYVEPSSKIFVSIGKGGSGAKHGGMNGQRGESSSFGKELTAEGGGGGFSGYYNSTMAYGGSGGGSGGGGGGNGVRGVCSGQGGRGGSRGENGWVSKDGGAGGAGTAWDSLEEYIHLVNYSPGGGGICIGRVNAYNGGGGGGGLILDGQSVFAESGTDSQKLFEGAKGLGKTEDRYEGPGGTGGAGYGAGGGGGGGADGCGGNGADGAVYIEYFTKKSEFVFP